MLIALSNYCTHEPTSHSTTSPSCPAAALALELPEALASIRAAHAQPGAERRAAIRAACEANLPPGKREAVQVMQERVQADRLPLLNLVQASPLEMQ